MDLQKKSIAFAVTRSSQEPRCMLLSTWLRQECSKMKKEGCFICLLCRRLCRKRDENAPRMKDPISWECLSNQFFQLPPKSVVRISSTRSHPISSRETRRIFRLLSHWCILHCCKDDDYSDATKPTAVHSRGKL